MRARRSRHACDRRQNPAKTIASDTSELASMRIPASSGLMKPARHSATAKLTPAISRRVTEFLKKGGADVDWEILEKAYAPA